MADNKDNAAKAKRQALENIEEINKQREALFRVARTGDRDDREAAKEIQQTYFHLLDEAADKGYLTSEEDTRLSRESQEAFDEVLGRKTAYYPEDEQEKNLEVAVRRTFKADPDFDPYNGGRHFIVHLSPMQLARLKAVASDSQVLAEALSLKPEQFGYEQDERGKACALRISADVNPEKVPEIFRLISGITEHSLSGNETGRHITYGKDGVIVDSRGRKVDVIRPGDISMDTHGGPLRNTQTMLKYIYPDLDLGGSGRLVDEHGVIHTAKDGIDGDYRGRTFLAVWQYQERYNARPENKYHQLPVTGTIDADTLTVLQNEFALHWNQKHPDAMILMQQGDHINDDKSKAALHQARVDISVASGGETDPKMIAMNNAHGILGKLGVSGGIDTHRHDMAYTAIVPPDPSKTPRKG